MSRYLIVLLVLLLGACASTDRQDADSAYRTPDTAPTAPGAGQEFALRALGYIGVPYRWGGVSPNTGFDCSGLIRYVYSQLTGQSLPYNSYQLSGIGDTVDREQLQPGDLVFFNTMRQPFSHVGIYLGDARFVHAPSTGGHVKISNMNNRYWQHRYNGARRLPI